MLVKNFKVAVTILIALMFCFTNSFSQNKKERKAYIKDSIYIMRVKLVRPQFRLDNRNLFFGGQTLNLNGFDAGVLLKDKLRLTLGYYSLNNNLSAYTKTMETAELERQLKLQYGSINTEFIYKSTRFFSLGMPLEFGFGGNTLQYKNVLSGEVQSRESGFVFITDFGLSATFKPIRWIGIRGVVGYRKTVFNQVKDFRFDSFFTSVGLNIDIREIVKDVQMYSLKKKYKRGGSSIGNAVDLITD